MKTNKNTKKIKIVKESADLLRKVNYALHNFIIAKPTLLTEIQPSQEQRLEKLVKEWEKFSSTETTPKKSDPDYNRILNMRKDVESEILSVIEFPTDQAIDDYDMDEEMEMSERKHILTFSEMNKVQEKIRFRIPSNNKPEEDRPHKNKVSQVKSEISQKLKQLDTILNTSEPTVTVQAEPVKELLERISYLIRKIK